ncbi:MAG TPA: hypothetical protein VHZ49_07305 [Methylomirabilota bacterium]|jgi:hypothetical protein|nr:hypothetical protein [Methylomirabilota bacterium]
MLLPGIIAALFMTTAGAVVSVDTPFGKAALYAFYRWQRRRRRSHRLADKAVVAAAAS